MQYIFKELIHICCCFLITEQNKFLFLETRCFVILTEDLLTEMIYLLLWFRICQIDHGIILFAGKQIVFWVTDLTELSRKGKPRILQTNKKGFKFSNCRETFEVSLSHAWTFEKMLTDSYFQRKASILEYWHTSPVKYYQ